MKKIIRKVKGKKVLSFVLAAIMLATTFNIALPQLKLDASAAGSITTTDGETVTQTKIVDEATRNATYENYAAQFLNGASRPTDIVIPGLDPAQDYVIQGMTYYPQKDWMLVTAYHNAADGETVQSTKVFCLDAATGDFVAMFSFLDPVSKGGAANTEHGGGIAISENNIYYACGDDDQEIAYAPLSLLEGIENEPSKYKAIQLVDYVTLSELGNSYTAYVCFDDGILWTGNFYDKGVYILGIAVAATDYSGTANSAANSMVYGYKLVGESSEEEWDYFKGKFQNLLRVDTGSGSAENSGSKCTWEAYTNGGCANIYGNITPPTAYVGEYTANFGSFDLKEGVQYTIEFTSTNENSDLYMFAPNNGGHCNITHSTQTDKTELADGRWHYKMDFTAGLMPDGAESSWPTTQSTDGTYTGTYTIRFDQDAIQAGETREFEFSNIKISQKNTYDSDVKIYEECSVGAPTYAICLNNAIRDVQYATVDNGKLYLSCSFGTGEGTASVSLGGMEPYSTLVVADIDLSVSGTKEITINGNKKIMAYDMVEYKAFDMMPMSEGLCVIDDNIFITFESASNKYLKEAGALTGNCNHPIDVIWQLDPYELMEQEVAEPENSVYYEKVNNLSEIESGKEYLIVYESSQKDPVTQRNILYAINSDGGLKGNKLSKSNVSNIRGYNAMVGHKINQYDVVGNILYLDNKEYDDVEAVRWTIEKGNDNVCTIKTTDSYYANCNNFYFDEDQISMAPHNAPYLSKIKLTESGNGNGGFYLSNDGKYYLWCNDGISQEYNKKITSHYIRNGKTTAVYSGITEEAGTFHCDARNSTGNNIIGASISSADSYANSVFYIYKRVIDAVSSTYESRVFTDLNAELKEDGTYTIDLETYAISPNHYQYVGERPTDFILVADTSNAMSANKDSTGIISYGSTNTLAVNSLCQNDDTKAPKNDDNKGVNGYAYSDPEEDIYYREADGKYYKVYLAINTVSSRWGYPDYIPTSQSYWAYYIDADGLYNVLSASGGLKVQDITEETFKGYVDNNQNYSVNTNSSSNGTRQDVTVYKGEHHRFDTNTGDHTRLNTIQTVAKDFVDDIASMNSENRIALVKYGADGSSGFYNTSKELKQDDYKNAFFSVSAKETVKELIDGLTTSTQTNNSGIEMDYVNAIISNAEFENEKVNYKAGGKRNVIVIFMSDGIPGADSNDATATAATAVINKALTAKQNGAFIYSVLTGQGAEVDFNRKTYMEAVSTKYAAATGMDKAGLGGESVDGVNYFLNLSSCGIDTYLDFGSIAKKEVEINTAVGLDNLNASAYLRQELSDSFIIPKGTIPQVSFIEGKFDAIGRFSFGTETPNPSGITANWTDPQDPQTLEITGYNYATEYISKGKTGNKLRIRIDGVLADPTADITNTAISNTDTTALYKTKTDMDNNSEPFKKFPTSYFNIPEYTYVLDYGLDMLDTDVNGTLCAVSDAPTKQNVADYKAKVEYTQKSANGLVKIADNSFDLLYHTTPTNMNDSGYVLIQRPEGDYDWFEIKVVPASNVYFEEEDMTYKTDDPRGEDKLDWGTPSDSKKIKDYRNLTEEGDVVGFENAYDIANSTYSNGTAKMVTVTESNRNSKTQTFDFVGTGVDIVSRCSSDTGILLVNIKNSAGKSIAASLVDTYCEAGTFNQTPVFNWSIDEAKGETYGTYTVEVSALYLSNAGALNPKSINKSNLIDTGLEINTSASFDEDVLQAMLDEAGVEDVSAKDVDLVWFDDNSIFNGGTGVAPTKKGTRNTTTVTELVNYIDGFRIYNPLGTDPNVYTESNVSYANVIDNLAATTPDTTIADGIAFITGILPDSTDENGNPILDENGNPVKEALTFANYESVGPTGELYLNGKGTNGTGNAISFKINRGKNEKVMLGLRAVNGTEATNISINDGTGDPLSVDIKSATEMYYDITECIDSTGEVVITITNNHSTNILAINHIKFSGGDALNGTVITPRSLARSADATEATTNKFLPLTQEDLVAIEKSMSGEPIPAVVKNGVIVPIVEEEVEIPEDNTNTDNDNTNDGADTEESEDGDFGILSLIKMLIAFIEQILRNAFGAGSIA